MNCSWCFSKIFLDFVSSTFTILATPRSARYWERGHDELQEDYKNEDNSSLPLHHTI